MSEYTELLNALHRCSADDECAGCPYWHEDGSYCDQEQLARDAAAAIEAFGSDNDILHAHIEDMNEVFRDKSIENQQLERHIEELQAEAESLDESCKKQLVAMASHVAELQAAQPHWVSVEERLPVYGEEVLIARIFYDGQPKHEVLTGHVSYKRADGSVVWNSTNVTHWMPLPNPPMEE